MVENDIRGILVGCDDLACDFINNEGGYCWVIKEKDWDNGCNTCTKKIDEYKNTKYFNIYFYVFKTKSNKPAKNSDEFRNKIFGFADIAKVQKNKYIEPNYRHHIKIKNLRLFTPKIRLDDFQEQLEYFDWTNSQIKNFGNTLATHGLLLTKKDCEFLHSFEFNNLEQISYT